MFLLKTYLAPHGLITVMSQPVKAHASPLPDWPHRLLVASNLTASRHTSHSPCNTMATPAVVSRLHCAHPMHARSPSFLPSLQYVQVGKMWTAAGSTVQSFGWLGESWLSLATCLA
eukprot:jgi/Ulvmu1/11058/UM007_0240.1